MGKSVRIILICIWLGCISCEKSSKVKVLKLAHELDVSHPAHKAMQYMADKLEQESDGKLRLQIYPSGQLGQERELLELLQIGSLDMTKVGGAVMENFSSDYRVFGLPYIFDDREHAYRVWDSEMGERILLSSQDELLRGLAYLDAGSRSFYTIDKGVHHPSDLEGLKIRVPKSNSAITMVQLLGGSPTPIAWGELYTALQQGVVDGAENNLPSFDLSHHYEVCNFLSLDEHTYIPDILLIGSRSWNRLSDQEKKWVAESAKSSSVFHRALWKDAEAKALKKLEKVGISIIRPDKEPFRKKVRPMYEPFEEEQKAALLLGQIKELSNGER